MDRAEGAVSTLRPLQVIQSALANVVGASAIASAWGYLAGYTYKDKLLDHFGLDFNAVQTSSLETLINGYYVTLYAIWTGAWSLALLLGVETVVLVLIFGIIVMGSRRKWRWATLFVTGLRSHEGIIDRILAFGILAAFFVLTTIGAVPAGALAAKHDIAAFSGVARQLGGRDYRVGSVSYKGQILAMDANVTWLLMTDRVKPLKTDALEPLARLGQSGKAKERRW